MKRKLIFTTAFFLSCILTAQIKSDSIKLFIGLESGLNHLSSYTLGERKDYVNFGALAEFVYDNKWSTLIKLRLYDVGVSYSYHPWHIFSEETHNKDVTYKIGESTIPDGDNYLIFKGKSLSIPISINRYFFIKYKIRPFINFGTALNYEIKNTTEETVLDEDEKKRIKRLYGCFYFGSGIEYIVSQNYKCGIHWDYTSGGYKGNSGNWLNPQTYVSNTFVNIYLKYRIRPNQLKNY